MNADKEMKRVCEYLELPMPQDNIVKGEKYKKPSHMASKDKEKFSIDTWKEQISQKDYQAGMCILKFFGFDDLYDENSLPNKECIKSIMN